MLLVLVPQPVVSAAATLLFGLSSALAYRLQTFSETLGTLFQALPYVLTLVAVTAIRAREINEYYNGLGSGHGALIPPQVSSLSNKSLSLAMEELYEGKLQFHRPTVDELENERLQAEALEQARQDANSDLDAFTDALRDA